MFQDNHLQFFTATILEWKHLLKEDVYKDIILNSLKFLVNDKRCLVYGFVIMPNHIHLLWQIDALRKREDVQRDFLRFTAQQMKFELQKNNPAFLEQFRVAAKDRAYQIWERNALSVDVWTPEVMKQKLDYIHLNPVKEKWKLSLLPEDYKYSSAKFYFCGIDEFGFLSHFSG
jgi:putative transposase